MQLQNLKHLYLLLYFLCVNIFLENELQFILFMEEIFKNFKQKFIFMQFLTFGL